MYELLIAASVFLGSRKMASKWHVQLSLLLICVQIVAVQSKTNSSHKSRLYPTCILRLEVRFVEDTVRWLHLKIAIILLLLYKI